MSEFRNKEQQLVELFARQRTPGTSERDLLLGGATTEQEVEFNSPIVHAMDRGIGRGQGEPSSSQEQALREQDEGLDSLHGIISRQRRLAEAIGGEAEAQVELLGGMGDDMERTGREIAETTRGVAAVERRSGGNGKYWAVILSLLVIIVIVAALPAKRKT